ncbi:MAG: 30S ribosomal protein S1 [Candidatus Melainabacteria bacterium]|nr:MAG: 30S ribosomal protein S1 [Candidatus Melainabacteria bacterium]
MKPITVSNNSSTSAFAALLAGLTFNNPEIGDIVDGEVMASTRGGFIVNIRTKSDAFLELDEAGDLKVGDKSRFVVIKKEDSDEEFTVSHKRVASTEQRQAAWSNLTALVKSQATTQAHVTALSRARANDSFAGAQATIDGIKCFIPRRELLFFGNPNNLVGTDIPVKVTSCDNQSGRKGDVILSHARAVQEQQRDFIATLKCGTLVKGKVARILGDEKGALIDLGGTTALLPRNELAQSRSARVADLVKVGEELELEVLRTDAKNGTVHLSRIGAVLSSLKYGQVTGGVVASVTAYGVFVSLQGCIDGLLHDSELDGAAKASFTAGAETSVRIKSVDVKQRRISLTLVGLPKQH